MVSSVRILTVGHCKQVEKFALPKSGRLREIEFPASVAVIEHPRAGILLFDTGYSPKFHEVTRRFPEKFYALATPVRIEPEQMALAQLKSLGIRERDISMVVLSHLHADHVAGVSDFQKSRLVLSGEGWNYFRDLTPFGGVRRAFLRALLPADIEARSQMLGRGDFNVPISELSEAGGAEVYGADLVGDESVMAVPLPGHCAGQLGLFVRMQGRQPLFFVADAAWSIQSIERNEPTIRFIDLLHHQPKVYRETLGALHRVHQGGKIQLIPCHCHRTIEKFS